MTVTSLQRACASMDAEMNSLCNSFSSLHIYSSEEEVALEMDVEMNTVLEEVALEMDVEMNTVLEEVALEMDVEMNTVLEEVALEMDV
eukprot:CAMPEP_0113470706 /NCGR_PEP_ID=MMETSP0014_2-20120614/16588_1 /TAXON_ID=2857 /ORGANISM="Nitzschia sp." /LENGTH=87 /DNA_ID=CAMNT_0000363293 /DNA_START=187 /DNA_END=447 /DNA_ORIENTATION=+ /assembly_acc=CAM_ASM_000159